MKVYIAKQKNINALVTDDGHHVTWPFTPKFSPHLDQFISKRSQDFCHKISTDYVQEKLASGSCSTLTVQIRLASLPDARTITVGTQKITTAVLRRGTSRGDRGKAELELGGRGLNNFWFLNIYNCRLSLRAEISFAEPRYYEENVPRPPKSVKRKIHCCDGMAINEAINSDQVYWTNYSYAGVINAVDIPINFDQGGNIVSTGVTPITLPDAVWSQFAYCLDDVHRIQLRAKTTLILEVDNYSFPRCLRQVICRSEFWNERDYVIHSGDGCQLMCHKSVLAAHSNLLAETVYGPFEKVKNGLTLSTFHVEEIEAFLKYLYEGDITGPNSQADLALRLCMIGHQLQVNILEEKMISLILSKPWHWLKASEGGATPIDLCLFARDMKNGKRLMDHVLDVIIENCDEFMTSKRYLQLSSWNPNAAAELSFLMVERAMETYFIIV